MLGHGICHSNKTPTKTDPLDLKLQVCLCLCVYLQIYGHGLPYQYMGWELNLGPLREYSLKTSLQLSVDMFWSTQQSYRPPLSTRANKSPCSNSSQQLRAGSCHREELLSAHKLGKVGFIKPNHNYIIPGMGQEVFFLFVPSVVFVLFCYLIDYFRVFPP